MAHFHRLLASSALALAMWCGPASAQLGGSQEPAPKGPIVMETGPYTRDQLFHELSGLWQNMHFISIEKFETEPVPLTPKYQAARDKAIRDRAEGRQVFTAESQCIPAGLPRMMLNGSFEVLVRDNSLGIITAGHGLQVRNIWLDGRKHTPVEDLFESFGGESIGHWEGSTLVVTTIGLNPTNEFLYGVRGHAMTVVERFRKVSPDVLEDAMTVTDPEVFTKPWVLVSQFRRTPGRAMTEQDYCVAALDREVNKDGVEGFDLTPPVVPDN